MTHFNGITRLVAEGFRGATSRLEITFSEQQPFVVLFGENGSGKSSLVDAIEYALRGTKGSLSDLSSTGLSDLASRGTPAPPLSVELEVAGQRWAARLERRKAHLAGPEEQPKIEILRRSRLTKIVAATPAERFAELKGFVDVEAVFRSEAALDRAGKEAGRRLDEAAQRVSDTETELQSGWIAAGSPGLKAVDWARTLSRPATADPLASTRAWLESVKRALDHLAGARRKAVETRTAAKDAQGAVDALTATASGEPSTDDRRFLELLRIAQGAVAAAKDLTACPVCRQPVAADSLRNDLAARLAQLREATQLLEQRQMAEQLLRDSGTAAALAKQELAGAFEQLDRAAEEPPAALSPEFVAQLTRLRDWVTPEVQGGEVGRGNEDGLAEQLAAAEHELREQEERQRRVESERAAIVGAVERLGVATAAARAAYEEKARLTRCLDIVRSTRKAFTEEVLAAVEGETNRLYETLHPGEGLVPVRFRLDEKQRASLHQVASFGDVSELAPQACFSDSHLLTLAFCLWLALAKRERAEETILVLDDAMAAVDASHTQRLAQLLAAEAPNFAQVLVATQSRRFQRYLRSGLSPSGKLDCRALRWTLRGGIVHEPVPHDADRLAAALAEPVLDRQVVASKAGVLLEAILRRMAALYRRRVPFDEPTEPTLGELFSAWKMSDAGKVRVERQGEGGVWIERGNLRGPLEKLGAIRDVRNLIGAHLNVEGDEVSDSEVEAYGRGVHELWTLLVCPSCAQIPCKPVEDVLRCHCKQTRLRPNRID